MQITGSVGQPVDVTYKAKNHTTGLIDVVAEIYDETKIKDVVNFPDVTLVEIGSTGVYNGQFTPDAKGVWTIMADSVSKSAPAELTVVVYDYDIDSVGDSVADFSALV